MSPILKELNCKEDVRQEVSVVDRQAWGGFQWLRHGSGENEEEAGKIAN